MTLSDEDNLKREHSGVSRHGAESDIDLDDYVYKLMIVFKTLMIICSIVSFCLVCWFAISMAPGIGGKIFLAILFSISIFPLLSYFCRSFLYKIFIKKVIKKVALVINTAISFKSRSGELKYIEEIMTFDVPIHDRENVNETKIETRGKIVTASQFKLSYRKSSKSLQTLYCGDYFAVEAKNKTLADGIWLVCGTPHNIREGKYSCKSKKYTMYADTAEYINDNSKKELFTMGSKIYDTILVSDFVLYYKNNTIHFIKQIGDYSCEPKPFSFNIKKDLINDLIFLKFRIKFGEVLADA
ncbi:MAG: hypothetical protein J6Y82_07880 [Bacteroidales bacterium]|nr:hypothetical protein [Bacteroidales bacterium]